MGSILNLEIGQYVEVEFMDHSNEKGHKEDSYGLILCRARGLVSNISPDCLVLQCWESILSDEEAYRDNQEVFCIATKVITGYREFIPWKWVKLY